MHVPHLLRYDDMTVIWRYDSSNRGVFKPLELPRSVFWPHFVGRDHPFPQEYQDALTLLALVVEDLRAVWSPSDKISHSAVIFTPDEQKPTTPEFDLLKRNRGQADRTSGDLMTPNPSHCQIHLPIRRFWIPFPWCTNAYQKNEAIVRNPFEQRKKTWLVG